MEEIAIILKSIPDTVWGHAFIVSMACGCRPQEMIPLTVNDIADNGSTININKAVKIGEHGKTYIGKTKSIAGERVVSVPKSIWSHAKWLRDHATNDLVFCSPEAKVPVHPSWYRKQLVDVAKGIKGVRALNPHCLRHTFATLGMFEANIKTDVLKSMTGHSDTKTLQGYTHVHSNVTEIAAAKIDRVLKQKTVKKKTGAQVAH